MSSTHPLISSNRKDPISGLSLEQEFQVRGFIETINDIDDIDKLRDLMVSLFILKLKSDNMHKYFIRHPLPR
jgi:hypothetical protein